MTTRNTILAILAAGLVALSAFAIPAMAKPGDDADDRRAAAKDRADQHRADAQARAAMHGNVTKERCMERHANATLNESAERGCMKVGEFAEKAFKARRAAHALLGAINATERQWDRLNATEAALEAKLAAGNFTGNETAASIEKRLERIDAKQERVEERLEKLQARLGKLHDKWAAVRDHVEQRRAQHDDEHDEDDASSSSSSSARESASESASASESSSSTAPA